MQNNYWFKKYVTLYSSTCDWYFCFLIHWIQDHFHSPPCFCQKKKKSCYGCLVISSNKQELFKSNDGSSFGNLYFIRLGKNTPFIMNMYLLSTWEATCLQSRWLPLWVSCGGSYLKPLCLLSVAASSTWGICPVLQAQEPFREPQIIYYIK